MPKITIKKIIFSILISLGVIAIANSIISLAQSSNSKLSGYAWNNNIGWISFSGNIVPNENGSTCTPSVTDSACSVSCGGGTLTRTTVNADCSITTQPNISCNTHSCSETCTAAMCTEWYGCTTRFAQTAIYSSTCKTFDRACTGSVSNDTCISCTANNSAGCKTWGACLNGSRTCQTYHQPCSSNLTDTTGCAPTCTSFTYSAWSTCSASSQQTRTITSSSPAGCTGGNPVTTQSCTPTCTSFTYSAWSPSTCPASRQQTRTITSSSPAGCTGGSPITTQSCTFTSCLWGDTTYINGSKCQSIAPHQGSLAWQQNVCSNGTWNVDSINASVKFSGVPDCDSPTPASTYTSSCSKAGKTYYQGQWCSSLYINPTRAIYFCTNGNMNDVMGYSSIFPGIPNCGQ